MKKFFKSMFYAFGVLSMVATTYAVAPEADGFGYSGVPSGSFGGMNFYDNGDSINFLVTFDQVVNVVGTPKLRFKSPENYTKKAIYSSGSGSNCLNFSYDISSTVNHNDWDGIEIPTNFLDIPVGSSIQNSSGEDVLETISNEIIESAIKIDSKAPTWDKIELSSTAGNVSGNTRYIPSGSTFTTYSFLTENDTRLSASVGLSVGGGATQTITYTGGNVNGHDKDAQKSGTLTGDGVVSLVAQSWIDQAGKNATGIPTFIINDSNPVVTQYVIDGGAPDFAGISVTSNNPYDPSYGKADSVLTFTLTLTSPDSYDGNGSIDFTIDGIPYSINFVDPANSAPAGTYTATFDLSTIAPTNNASINITNLNFADFFGQNITNFSAGTPAPTVLIDTQAPTLSSASANTNGVGGTFAKIGETVTFSLNFDEEIIREILNSASTAHNISSLTKEFNISAWGNNDTIQFTVQNGDNGIVTLSNADFSIVDHAGNSTLISHGDINSKVAEIIMVDTVAPTISNVTIFSNNTDPTLAKTNDTITVQFDTSDNASPTVDLVNGLILNSSVVDGVSGIVGVGKNIARFTDGTETSEVIVPFSIKIKDQAGNESVTKTTTDDGSSVRFDRTDPIVQEVKISAISADNTAYLGDIPNYYTKQGDTVDFELQVCDYVDSQNSPPTGTFFNQAITLNDAGQTGIACITPEGNPSVWRKWTWQILGINGIEGLITFSIDVKDNAGNILVNVAGTTDGSSVIFDKTIPLNPTDVVDSLGNEIVSFKHRSRAQFSWTNDADNTINTPIVSGIQSYHIRLTNPANGGEEHRNQTIFSRNFDGRFSNLAPWTGQAIPPRDITDPYDLNIKTRDKAGNDALETVAYTQPYTIGFVGTVTDDEGTPISGATVQVVSRYGETCDLNREVCTGVTNSNGEYSVLAQKDQEYNITYFHQRYYLSKYDEPLGHDDDVIINPILNGIESVHEEQTLNQVVEITTSEKFVGADGQLVATKIWVHSLSGEISVNTSIPGQIGISSLSTITLVNSNNSAIQIVNNGNNTYTIFNAGTVLSITNQTGASGGTSQDYPSGGSRIGTKYVASNGNPHNTFGKFKTPAEWKAFSDRLRYGVKPEIITYINRNGYEIFAGYKYGILGWDRPTVKRFQNQVKFRGISRLRRNKIILDPVKAQKKLQEIETLSVRWHEAKTKYQNPVVDKEKEFLVKLETLKPLKRITKKDVYKSVLNKRAQKTVNKWERRGSFGEKVSRDPYANKLKTIKIRFSNGASAKIRQVIR